MSRAARTCALRFQERSFCRIAFSRLRAARLTASARFAVILPAALSSHELCNNALSSSVVIWSI